MAQRVTFYIDGFNFYYGLRRTKRNEPQWADYYWINMVKLCQGFLGEGQEVEKVIYFTASPLNPEKSSRQSAFLNANKPSPPILKVSSSASSSRAQRKVGKSKNKLTFL